MHKINFMRKYNILCLDDIDWAEGILTWTLGLFRVPSLLFSSKL